MDRHFRQQPQPIRDAVDRVPLPDAGHGPASGSGAIEDDTALYILEAHRLFEDLRQVAAQLAGLLVLNAAGSQSAGPHHPMLETANRLHQETVEALHHARVPPLARAHHQHLLEAANSLRAALSAANSSLAIDPILVPLRAAYAHLQRASHELPGFHMVSFKQGCCGRKA